MRQVEPQQLTLINVFVFNNIYFKICLVVVYEIKMDRSFDIEKLKRTNKHKSGIKRRVFRIKNDEKMV